MRMGHAARQYLREAELVREMGERLVRCAALSALCVTLREQVAEHNHQKYEAG